jgi:hypothetical protein
MTRSVNSDDHAVFLHVSPTEPITSVFTLTIGVTATMAEQAEYALTHEPPSDTELALLCAFIDQRVSSDLLCHKTRMFELIRSNGLIARSIMEQRFISRV